jgi:hypothetical protein
MTHMRDTIIATIGQKIMTEDLTIIMKEVQDMSGIIITNLGLMIAPLAITGLPVNTMIATTVEHLRHTKEIDDISSVTNTTWL